MLPSEAYQQGISQQQWQFDQAQQPALEQLDRIYRELQDSEPASGFLSRIFSRKQSEQIQGLYLWGGVGRGKTFLIDLFYEQLPLQDVAITQVDAGAEQGKCRVHFHRFMREVHARLKQHAGERDPIAHIIADWRKQFRVLVLDEFIVIDIGDAMLLGRLLDRMFAEGMVLVTTSNTAPDHLYKDGLQRVRFLPAIELLKNHCIVLELISDTDYRLRELTRTHVYHVPADAASHTWLRDRWNVLTNNSPVNAVDIEIEGRALHAVAEAKGVIWFTFDALCNGPRGTTDYIEIASEYHTVLLQGIPQMDDMRKDSARRFINLIDELYDQHVNLVCTAQSEPVHLYKGTQLGSAFERTSSRLIEMQSEDYLATHHRYR